MTPDEYRQQASRTEFTPRFVHTAENHKIAHGVQRPDHDLFLARALHALLGMMTELGELADVFKKHIIYGKPIDYVNVIEELGDGDWYRALFANALEVGFEESWKKNIDKLRKRYPDKFTQEQALTRDLGAERAALEGASSRAFVDAEGNGIAVDVKPAPLEGIEGNPKG